METKFDLWWRNHLYLFPDIQKNLIRVIYESAVLDVAEFIETQQNDIPATGKEFSKAILCTFF